MTVDGSLRRTASRVGVVSEAPTIAAIATGASAAALGIIRVSGSLALAAVRSVAPRLPLRLEPGRALLTSIVDADGRVLDRGLVLYFAGPRSFTGEDVVELQLHGAPRLLRAVLRMLTGVAGVRLAEPGEFTRRAYLNGRIDLAQAEAVGQLLTASSDRGLRAAAAQLAGELSERLARLREPLLALAAEVEATLDFPDETAGVELGWRATLAELAAQARGLAADTRRGALLRRRPKVVLYGPVNAGKSTLFNRLVGAERALVDEEAGTTRDALESELELGDVSITLMDTAGLRSGAGRIESLGIARTRAALESSDLAVLVLPPWAGEEEASAWRGEVPDARRLDVRSMADLGGAQWKSTSGGAGTEGGTENGGGGEAPVPFGAPAPIQPPASGSPSASRQEPQLERGLLEASAAVDVAWSQASWGQLSGGGAETLLSVSGRTGEGVEVLRAALEGRLGGELSSSVLLTSERQHDAIRRVEEAVDGALAALESSTADVVAGELRSALESIEELLGGDASKAILDAVFSRFCIGK